LVVVEEVEADESHPEDSCRVEEKKLGCENRRSSEVAAYLQCYWFNIDPSSVYERRQFTSEFAHINNYLKNDF